MVSIAHLISHRFRGFAPHENTIDGVNAALEFGVLNLEFDIRVTRCGTPMIYHDEFARDGRKRKRHISNLMASELAGFGGTFAYMPTADALFEAIRKHSKTDAQLLIDIKDAGFEDIIHALVCAHGLESRVTYVSWVPNVLYRMFEIAPGIPLCLSHWCKTPNKAVRLLHKVHEAQKGHVPRLNQRYIHGERSGWFVKEGLKGDLRDMIIATKGSVCVPQNMVTRELVEAYHADNIQVSTFSYTKWKAINAHKEKFGIDLFFIDDKRVFDAL